MPPSSRPPELTDVHTSAREIRSFGKLLLAWRWLVFSSKSFSDTGDNSCRLHPCLAWSWNTNRPPSVTTQIGILPEPRTRLRASTCSLGSGIPAPGGSGPWTLFRSVQWLRPCSVASWGHSCSVPAWLLCDYHLPSSSWGSPICKKTSVTRRAK